MGISLALIPLLIVLPATWIVVALRPTGLGLGTRLALGVALVPAFVGILALATRAAGLGAIPAGILAGIAGVAGLPAFVRDCRGASARPVRPRELAAIGLPIAWVCAVWLMMPGFRLFNWHALLRSDLGYALTRSTGLPEDPEFAGFVCSYSWFPELYWSVLGLLTDVPPTALMPISNLLWIAIQVVLSMGLARAIGLGGRGAALSATLALFGTNALGILLWFASGQTMAIDVKYTPILAKYTSLDGMPYANALYTGLALALAADLRRPMRGLAPVVFALMLGLGVVYPSLLPAGLLTLACWAVVALPRRGGRHGSPARWAAVVGAGALAAAPGLALVHFTGVDRATPAVYHRAPLYMAHKAVYLALAIGPLALPALVVTRRAPAAFLLLTAAGTGAMFISLNMVGVEYKNVFPTTFCLAPLAVGGLRIALRRHTGLRSALLTWVLPVVLAGLTFTFFVRITKIGSREDMPRVVERSYQFELADTEPDAGWTRAVCRETPPDTILVTRDNRIYVGAFASRSRLCPMQGDSRPVGYLLDSRWFLIFQRGYPEQEYDRREALVDALYDSNDPAGRAAALEGVREFGRPVALHLTASDSGLRDWLGRSGIARTIYSGDLHEVWIVDAR